MEQLHGFDYEGNVGDDERPAKRLRVPPKAGPTLALLVARLTAHEPDIGALIFLLSGLEHARIDRRRFASAEAAFKAVDADTVAFARLAKASMRRLTAAIQSFDPNACGRTWGGSVSDLHSQLFDTFARLTSKTWKVVKQRGSDRVCFFSDAYDLDEANATMLASACGQFHLDVAIFEWDYPDLRFEHGYFFPKKAKVIGWGYQRLYRGKLVGFILSPPQ